MVLRFMVFEIMARLRKRIFCDIGFAFELIGLSFCI